MSAHRKAACRWLHRWCSLDHAVWVGGIGFPAFQFICRRCGATKIERYGP